ncbi:hypothetical protein M3Y95_01031300 [Aphelenchoides besseyi]|nr:hypothetical protein M3Y95_01031300 [Aphelenchoides besseyi]
MLKRLLLFLLAFINFVVGSQPCDGKIVLVLDASAESSWLPSELFNDQKNFVKKLLAASNFDNYERLVIGFYDDPATLTNFGDLKNESDVFNYIDSIKQGQTLDWLGNAFYNVYEQNYTDATVIFFVSMCIGCGETDYTTENAKGLRDQGLRLVLVDHAGSKRLSIDDLVTVTNDSSTVFDWDPRNSLPVDDYQEWFKQVIGCPNAKPKPPLVNPCRNQLLLVLDASMNWIGLTDKQFNHQKELVKSLFTDLFFDDFEKLALGFYSNSTNLTNFGDFRSESDVAKYADSIERDPTRLSYLQKGLQDVYDKGYSWKGNFTVIFFVSDLETSEVEDARQKAKQLQDAGVHLVLVGHGDFDDDYINMDRLAYVTGDSSAVFKWEEGYGLPFPNYVQWFNEVAC